MNMKINLAGVELKNPVMTASGTFGSGEVLSVVAMTSDALLEVRFDGVGVKKLMSNFAKLEIEDEV